MTDSTSVPDDGAQGTSSGSEGSSGNKDSSTGESESPRGEATSFLDKEQLAAGIGTDEALIGLSLSGGGIRSATFNLGLLQGLDRLGLLPAFHYLSTVSGGGYVGGFWTAWRHRNTGRTLFPRAPEERETEADAIRHLREFSNFLSPRLGLLSWDTGRLVIAVVSAMLPSLAATLALLVLVVSAPAWSYSVLAQLSAAAAAVVLGALTLFILWVMERWLRRREGPGPAGFGSEDSAAPGKLAGRSYLGAALVAALAAGALWYRFLHPAGDMTGPGEAFAWWIDLPRGATLFSPSLAWLLPSFGILVLRAASSGFIRGPSAVQVRGAFDRVAARFLLLAGIWVAFAALWSLVRHVGAPWEGGVLASYGAVTAGVMGAFAWLRRLMGAGAREGQVPTALVARLKPLLPALLAWVAVLLLVAGAMGLVMTFGAGPDTFLWLIGGAVALSLGTLFLLDPNRVGLHSFYRGRLARAYLGASNPAAGYPERRNTEEVEGDDLLLSDTKEPSGRIAQPLHLICTTANELAPLDPLEGLQRGGRSAVLSAYGFSVDGVGQPWTDKDAEPRGASPSLGSALTTSAAAFNPMMGSFSRRFGPAVTFLMAALNLRLGRWIRHPSAPGAWKNWRLPGLLFYKELLGYSRTDGSDVHLSDGGHFENMGLYELIRRRCRYIVASDCGADPDVSFKDVANLVRRARTDFGVEIKVDVSALEPDDRGRSRQPAVAGDILYPDGKWGVLLLFKPTLTGQEPVDIVQYRHANEAFPHESTLDQFYDEAQWESYRRLGRHAVEAAFGFARKNQPWWLSGTSAMDPKVLRRQVPSLFAEARKAWLPGLPDALERRSRISEELRRLDELLRDSAPPELLAEVWKEAGEVGDVTEVRTRSGEEATALSLHGCRHALLFFENAYRVLDLEHRHGHADSLSVMNLAGRWTAAPTFRFWWPILRSLHSPQFVRFFDEHFDLAGLGRKTVLSGPLTGKEILKSPRFAASCWRTAQRPTGEDDKFVALEVVVSPPESSRVRSVEAGLLRYRSEAATEAGNSPPGTTLVWTPSDFFVPPGLWGMGMGTAFLARLLADPPLSAARLAVEVGDGIGATDETMYREAGFATDPSGGPGRHRLQWERDPGSGDSDGGQT